MSADPAMGEYLTADRDNAPAGGVFTPLNLQTYHYGGNNPLKYTDPTGMYDSWEIDDAALDRFRNTGEAAHFYVDMTVEDFRQAIQLLILFLPGGAQSATVKVFTEAIKKIPGIMKLATLLGMTIEKFAVYLWNAGLKGIDVLALLLEFKADGDTKKLIDKLTEENSQLKEESQNKDEKISDLEEKNEQKDERIESLEEENRRLHEELDKERAKNSGGVRVMSSQRDPKIRRRIFIFVYWLGFSIIIMLISKDLIHQFITVLRLKSENKALIKEHNRLTEEENRLIKEHNRLTEKENRLIEERNRLQEELDKERAKNSGGGASNE